MPEMPDRTAAPPSSVAEQKDATAAQSSEAARLADLLEAAERREADARRALSALAAIVNQMPVALTVQSDDGKTLFANDTATAWYGAAAGAATTTAPLSGNPAENDAGGTTLSEDCLTVEHGTHTLLRACRPASLLDRHVLVSASIDFTRRKHIETELSKRAYFDDLTALPNRASIQEHVEQLLADDRPVPRFALAFIDIDNFKHINDYYTHAVGDALLVKVAQRIAAHIRPSDVVGRISGDEFLLVINPVDRDAELDDLVNALLQELKEPFLIEGFEVLTSASIGVSIHPDHGTNYEMLRRAADTAMYRIKAGAKGGAVMFNSDIGRDMNARMAQEQRLRLAVRDRRFCCAFQPKVDIRTEEVAGVEALIRLRDEDGVIQAPGQFIGLATELGLIDDLTYLALGEIIGSIDLLDETFGPHATISINVAAQQAGDAKFMRAFCDELDSTGYAGRFIVEVTEDAFIGKSRFQSEVLPMLREIGAKVSIDDFGTGYSSLAVLADITADEIKIDRSFITDIQNRPRNQSILRAIEAMSEPLGMTMIAEGVETFEEAAYLQAATRIRLAQGFYYSKPVLMEDLTPARSVGNSRVDPSSRERAPSRRALATRR
jgi:diguanylate cyclase (GGDEF)-like protein